MTKRPALPTRRAIATAAWLFALPLATAAAMPADAPEAPEAPAALRMAITFDDLPAAPPHSHSTAQQETITTRLLALLAKHRVPAVGFVNESKLVVDGAVEPARVKLLERWLDAGHELGNHGYDHLDLHRVDPDVWLADVWRGERVTRLLVEDRGGSWRWFRHPFLHTGQSAEIQRRTASALADHGYRIAPVTIDNGEWIYGRAYADAWNRGDQAAMKTLGDDYLRYMLEVVTFYQGQAAAIVGEGFPQVLLVHAYALNADHLDRVLDALAERGYRWISLGEALEHPAYGRATHGYTGSGGITWLHRWAITEGMDRALFRGEPDVPAWVQARSDAAFTRSAPDR